MHPSPSLPHPSLPFSFITNPVNVRGRLLLKRGQSFSYRTPTKYFGAFQGLGVGVRMGVAVGLGVGDSDGLGTGVEAPATSFN